MKLLAMISVLLILLPIKEANAEPWDFNTTNSSTANLSELITQASQKQPLSGIDHSWELSTQNAEALRTAKVGQTVAVERFPWMGNYPQSNVGIKSARASMTLERYEIFSPNAKILVISNGIEEEIPRPDLHAFASTKDGVGILVNTATGDVTGLYNFDGISMDITGNLATTLKFKQAVISNGDDDSIYQCGTSMAMQLGDPFAKVTEALSSRSVSTSNTNAPAFQTVIAVDTDMEWMAGKSNNTTTALNYINTVFVNMNVFMERDLSLRLLIGTTYLRIGADPISPEASIVQYLTDFGEYWRTQQTAVERDFVVLLSGENINSNSFSGIAWLDVYCEKGFQFNSGAGIRTAGSYSVNRIGANASAGFISQFIGHELGHNFGSPHTHCYIPAVDTCFNAAEGCYEGPVSCPVGGKGTIMSSCHVSGPNGAGCGLSNSEFHPTVSGLIGSRIVANSPSCIAPLAIMEGVFEDGFE